MSPKAASRVSHARCARRWRSTPRRRTKSRRPRAASAERRRSVKTYLVFEPQADGRTPEEAERVVFLLEKFSWPALIFGPLWLLWNRLWLAFAFWLAAVGLIAAAIAALHLATFAATLALSVPSLILAFEATLLRQQKLLAGGFREAGVVLAEDIESAERRFF